MLKAKRILAACIVFLMTCVPMMALGETITFTFIVSTPYGSETRYFTVEETMSVCEFEATVRSSLGVSWSMGAEGNHAVCAHYPNGATFYVSRNTKHAYSHGSAYSYVAPFGYGYATPYAPYAPSTGSGANAAAKKEETNRDSMGGITWSTEYLYQVYVNGRSLDARLFGDGTKLAFLLSFDRTQNNDIRMTMTVRGFYEQLKPVFTKSAINFLRGLDVGEVRIASKAGEVTYSMSEMDGLAVE